MEITFFKRKLNEEEIDALVEEIKKFPNPLTGKKSWRTFDPVYIARNQNELVGVCGVKKVKKWKKLGPFVVFQKYHGKGFGRTILETVMKDYSNDNMFIGSRNPAVAKIATRLGFHEIKSIFHLPNELKKYLLGYFFENVSLEFFKELIRKKPASEGPYRCFVREKNDNFSI